MASNDFEKWGFEENENTNKNSELSFDSHQKGENNIKMKKNNQKDNLNEHQIYKKLNKNKANLKAKILSENLDEKLKNNNIDLTYKKNKKKKKDCQNNDNEKLLDKDKMMINNNSINSQDEKLKFFQKSINNNNNSNNKNFFNPSINGTSKQLFYNHNNYNINQHNLIESNNIIMNNVNNNNINNIQMNNQFPYFEPYLGNQQIINNNNNIMNNLFQGYNTIINQTPSSFQRNYKNVNNEQINGNFLNPFNVNYQNDIPIEFNHKVDELKMHSNGNKSISMSMNSDSLSNLSTKNTYISNRTLPINNNNNFRYLNPIYSYMNDQMFNYNRMPINMNVYNSNMYPNIKNINSEQNIFKYPQFQMNNNNNNVNNHLKNNIDMKKNNNNIYMRNILVNNNNKGSKSYQNQNNKNSIPIYNNSINLNFDKINNENNNNNTFSSGNVSPKNKYNSKLNNLINKDENIQYYNLFHDYYKSKNNKNKYLFNSVFLNLKLPNGSEINETINLENEENLYLLAQKYVLNHNLNQNLVNPIFRKLSKSLEKSKEIITKEINYYDNINLNKISKYYLQEDEKEGSVCSIEDLLQNNLYINYFKEIMPSYEESEATQLLNWSI